MRQLAQPQTSTFALIVLNGAEKGVTYRLSTGKITIGRGSDNTISITDDQKISRHHAVINVLTNGVEITDVSDRNKVIVGQETVTSRKLRSGDIIHLGNTKFQFKEIVQTNDLELVEESSNIKMPSRSKKQKSGKLTFYILILVVVAIFGWLLTSSKNQPASVKIRTDDDFQANIDSNKKIIATANLEKARMLNSSQFEAQTNFIKGFRDYRKGQYDRAIESFQACLSLFSTHPQCQRYLRLAEKKFYELIQYHMVLANKYRAQNQFSACKASYRNAMLMIKNPSDKIYIEAKSGHDTCQALEEGRF